MEERILVVSDIHSNWPAFKTVLEDAKNYGPYTRMFCLGDIVGYGPFPNECVDAVRREGFESILGNHDNAVRGGDYLLFNSRAKWAVNHNRKVLTSENMGYLQGLRNNPVFDPIGKFGLVHGSFAPNAPGFVEDDLGATEFEDIYVLKDEDAYQAMGGMQYKEGDNWISVPIGFVGHTHEPMIARAMMGFDESGRANYLQRMGMDKKTIEDYRNGTIVLGFMPVVGENLPKVLVNFGSVGQPRHGSPEACYGIATFGDDGFVHFQYRSVSYPVAETQQRMIKEGFPDRLINRLSAGQ